MIAVTGATGTVGRHVVRQLALAGHRIRALVRTQAKAEPIRHPGVEIVVGDMSQPETLGGLLDGTQRLFLLTPDLPGQEKLRLEASVIDAAATAGVQHVVYQSNAGGSSDLHAFARLHRESEHRIERSGLAWTHLRCNAFMSNVLFSVESIRTDNAIYLPTGDGQVSAIDPQDIAAVAVEALTEDGHERKAYRLTGPQALSYADQAAQLSAVIGRHIVHVDVSEAQAREAMLAAGVPAEVADDLLDFYSFVKRGQCGFISTDFDELMARKPHSFAAFVAEIADTFS